LPEFRASENTTSIDITAADALGELDEALHAAGIELCFAEMKDPFKDKLKRFGIFRRLGEHTFFATLGQAQSDTLRPFLTQKRPIKPRILNGPPFV
jgi:hypothetical protein